ncbi:MAG TPA: phytanoyl-CoA dioxygenase family protein [Deltaproteobacteria bacterium]|nr:phytanoyl-CoA dioxygenase family protein [Deltaproteobacteria bacterium]
MKKLCKSYQDNGFVVIPNLFNESKINELLAETLRLCREEGSKLPKTHLLTNKSHPPSNIDEMSDDELLSHFLALHFPHKMSPSFRSMLDAPELVPYLAMLIGPNVKCMQSMLFVKKSGKPGQAWHQDEHFIPTRDRSLTGVWIALDDATIENGCLWIIPGSHKAGVLYPVRSPVSKEYDGAPEAFNYPYSPDEALPVEVSKGSVVFFHGYLLHSSLKNRSKEQYRRALVHHYMSAESLLPWDCGGQIPTTRDNRDIVMVCGRDPYNWKGIEDVLKPYIRGEREPTQIIENLG